MDQDYSAMIAEALEKPVMIVIAAECEINYYGKVESFLPLGDRMIIIKADKTLLVHQPSGVAPVNYMKEGSEHRISKVNGQTFLKSRHLFYKDYMDINLVRIHFVDAHQLDDGHKIQLSGSEEHMSDMIFNNPELIEKGFKPYSREEHTKYGFIDVFGTDKDGKLVIIECKRDLADFKAVSQLHRYIHKMMDSKGISENTIRGIIAAPKISENALDMLKSQGYEFKSIQPPKYLERYDKKQKRLGEY